ncbi:MAG: DUF4292 domain-containing protein [Bacteroidota bacterium]
MKSFFRLGFILLLFCGLSACKKKPSKTQKPLAEQLGIQNVDFEFLEARGKLTYEDAKERVSVTAIVRMSKDSLIWVSLRAPLGIEGLRALVRPDSAFVLNRLKNEYSAYDMKGLSKMLNVDVNFEMLQAVFVGNMLPLESSYEEVIKGEKNFLISQKMDIFNVESQVSRANKKLVKLDVQDTVSDNHLSVEYKDFRPVKGKLLMPFSGLTVIDYHYQDAPQRSTVEVDFQRIELKDEPLTFPFTVPDRFKKK